MKKRRQRAATVLDELAAEYPEAGCSLMYETPFQLLIAVVLSAQCTDAKVNKILPVLFREFPKPKDLAKASQSSVEKVIRPLGLYRNKAENIRAIAKETVGVVSRTIEELMKLPGVGRKTANVVYTELESKAEGIAVDTHCGRLARRLGFTRNDTPQKIETDLLALLPKSLWHNVTHLLIAHGRAVCTARNPSCDDCVLGERLCPSYKDY